MATDKKLTVKGANWRVLEIPQFNNGRPDTVHVAQTLWTYVAAEMSLDAKAWDPAVVVVCDNDVEYGKAALYKNGEKIGEVDILGQCPHCGSHGVAVWFTDCYTKIEIAEEKVRSLARELELKNAEVERLLKAGVQV